MLVETCLGIAAIFLLAASFAGLVGFVGQSSRDAASVQEVVRSVARTGDTSGHAGFALTCGAQPDAALGPCAARVLRGVYVRVAKDTSVTIGLGLVLHTAAKAVARAE